MHAFPEEWRVLQKYDKCNKQNFRKGERERERGRETPSPVQIKDYGLLTTCLLTGIMMKRHHRRHPVTVMMLMRRRHNRLQGIHGTGGRRHTELASIAIAVEEVVRGGAGARIAVSNGWRCASN